MTADTRNRFVERYLTAWACAGAGALMWLLAGYARHFLPRFLGLIYAVVMAVFLFRALFKGAEWVAVAQKALKQQVEIELLGPTEWAQRKAVEEAEAAAAAKAARRAAPPPEPVPASRPPPERNPSPRSYAPATDPKPERRLRLR